MPHELPGYRLILSAAAQQALTTLSARVQRQLADRVQTLWLAQPEGGCGSGRIHIEGWVATVEFDPDGGAVHIVEVRSEKTSSGVRSRGGPHDV